VGKLEGRDYLEDLGVNKIMLTLIFKKQAGKVWSGLLWQVVNCLEHGNGLSVL
jgi:hypothetical protein